MDAWACVGGLDACMQLEIAVGEREVAWLYVCMSLNAKSLLCSLFIHLEGRVRVFPTLTCGVLRLRMACRYGNGGPGDVCERRPACEAGLAGCDAARHERPRGQFGLALLPTERRTCFRAARHARP